MLNLILNLLLLRLYSPIDSKNFVLVPELKAVISTAENDDSEPDFGTTFSSLEHTTYKKTEKTSIKASGNNIRTPSSAKMASNRTNPTCRNIFSKSLSIKEIQIDMLYHEHYIITIIIIIHLHL